MQPYEVGGAVRQDISAVGPLVFYTGMTQKCQLARDVRISDLFISQRLTEKDKGGHFPALDNPDELLADIREYFAVRWQ